MAHLGKLPNPICEEPHHTKGNDIKQCRTCSKGVCMTCIVKTSMQNFNENVFQSRRRLLCRTCWNNAKSPTEHDASRHLRRVYHGSDAEIPLSPSFVPAKHLEEARELVLRNFCHCAPHDSTLCHACKTQQRSEALLIEARCTGPSCTALVSLENYGGSRCRWCGLMCGPATRIERRELFRARRRSTIKHTVAVGKAEHVTGELTFDEPSSAGEGEQSEARREPCASPQARFKVASDESFVERRFGVYEEEAWAREQARFEWQREAAMAEWRQFTSLKLKPLTREQFEMKSKPLIREGEVPKSLALFKPLALDEQQREMAGGDDDDKTRLLTKGEGDDDDTLYGDHSDGGTLRDGKVGGKGKVIECDDGDDEDDARTITSLGSTLFDGVEAGSEMAEQSPDVPLRPPQYGSVIPTEADREWALFCAKGF